MDTDEFPPPFGPAEWERLRLLDRFCDLSFGRYNQDPSGSACRDARFPPRIWLVSIQRRGGMAYDIIRIMRPRLKDAMLEAVEEAEQKGWNLAKE
jgi:hypothetical protein